MADESWAAKLCDFLKLGANVASITVGGTNVVWTKSMPMPANATFSWFFKMSSVGVVNVKIELEQSNIRPATEQASDPDYVVPEGASAMITITDTSLHIVGFAPKVSRYCRLKMTGLNSGTTNDAATKITQAQMDYVLS